MFMLEYFFFSVFVYSSRESRFYTLGIVWLIDFTPFHRSSIFSMLFKIGEPNANCMVLSPIREMNARGVEDCDSARGVVKKRGEGWATINDIFCFFLHIHEKKRKTAQSKITIAEKENQWSFKWKLAKKKILSSDSLKQHKKLIKLSSFFSFNLLSKSNNSIFACWHFTNIHTR